MDEYGESTIESFLEKLADLAEMEGIPTSDVTRWLKNLDGIMLASWYVEEYAYEEEDDE